MMHHHTKFDRSEILSGQTFIEVQNLHCDLDLEYSKLDFNVLPNARVHLKTVKLYHKEAYIHNIQTKIFEGRSFHHSGFSSEGSIYLCLQYSSADTPDDFCRGFNNMCIARVKIIIFIVRLATNVSVPFAAG